MIMIKKEDKTLFKNTILLYIMMVSTFIFPLITFPFLTRVLGKENYGIIVFTNAVMQYFQLFIDFGFILSGTEICSKERNNKSKLELVTSSIVYSKLILSLVGFIILIVLVLLLDVFNGKELFIIISYIPLVLTSFIPDYLFRGIEQMGIITARTIFSKLLYTLIIFLFVRSSELYYFIPFASFLSNGLIVIWSWSYIKNKVGIKLIKVNFGEVKEQLSKSSTFFTSRIATTVYSASNIFVLGLFGYNDEKIGIYGSANTLINYGKSMFSPIADSLYPYMVKNKNHKLVKRIILILTPLILIGCLLLYIFSDLFITIMCGKEYIDSVPYFRLMIPLLIVTLPSYLYGFPMLGSIGKNNKANESVIIGSIFHFICLIFLFTTKKLNFNNIIILTIITETIILFIRIYYFNKYKNRKEN